jgi:ABC-type amino acid transport substrate-binding protein
LIEPPTTSPTLKTKFELFVVVTNKVLYKTVEDLEGMVKSGMQEGVVETMDRFAELLGKESG